MYVVHSKGAFLLEASLKLDQNSSISNKIIHILNNVYGLNSAHVIMKNIIRVFKYKSPIIYNPKQNTLRHREQ